MAYIFDKFIWQSGGHTMRRLKNLLVTAGWTVKYTSTGSGSQSSSDLISNDAIMNTQNAYYVVRMPDISGVQREILVQNTDSNSGDGYTYFKCAYSAGAGFTGGDATTAPDATDRAFGNWTGWPTNASNAFNNAQMFDNSTSKYVVIIADNAAPYGFSLNTFSVTAGTSTGDLSGYFTTGGMMLDPLISGTYDAADADPYVFHHSRDVPTQWMRSTSLQQTSIYSSKVYGWVRKGLSNPLYLPFYVSSIANRGACVSNPYTGKDDTCAATYVVTYDASVTSWPWHIKGTSSMLRWLMQNRNTGDTLSVNSTRDRIVIGHMTLPWDGSSPAF